ncbi:MAG: hypothetical protein Q7S96_02355 [bacterium]|nr:hypothetical protein [bacterium]
MQEHADGKRKRVPVPMRVGKMLTLVNVTYQRSWDAGAGVYQSRAVVVLHMVGHEDMLCHGIGRAPAGTITAIELALRDAISRASDIAVPPPELLAFEIHVASGNTEPSAPANATAEVSVAGCKRRVQIDHPDGATAGALLLFDVYDLHLFERWSTLLKGAHVDPHEVLERVRTYRNRPVAGDGVGFPSSDPP